MTDTTELTLAEKRAAAAVQVDLIRLHILPNRKPRQKWRLKTSTLSLVPSLYVAKSIFYLKARGTTSLEGALFLKMLRATHQGCARATISLRHNGAIITAPGSVSITSALYRKTSWYAVELTATLSGSLDVSFSRFAPDYDYTGQVCITRKQMWAGFSPAAG